LASGAEIHSDRRLPSLTGLRIFAAITVYLSHVGAPQGSPEVVVIFFGSGYSGVTLFFVLSGFVLSVNYFDAFRRPQLGTTYNFFVARFARIYPLYIVVLFYIVVHDRATGVPIDGWWQNALAIQAWSPDVVRAFSFDGPAWSLSVEFFLYACFPLLVPLIGRIQSARSILLAAAGVAVAMCALVAAFLVTGHGSLPMTDPGSAHRWLYRTPLTRLGDFALGILAARLFVVTRGSRPSAAVGHLLAIGGAVTFLALMAWPALYFTAWSWDVAYAIPAVLLIFGLAISPTAGLARFLARPTVVILGEASFAFYLIHQPLLLYLGGAQWLEAVTPAIVIDEMLIFGAVIGMALGLHLGLELPARRWIRRRFSRSEAQVT
jgi:peptidoglycan/LPS O-acetylase OafA/YrhL